MSQESPDKRNVSGPQREAIAIEDLDFVADCKVAFLEEKMPYANILLLSIMGLVVACLLWAYQSQVSELTRGQGKIIPSGSLQIVQSLEGGIVSGIDVREGQRVEQGRRLAKIDDTTFRASYRENLAERNDLMAKISRLEAELSASSEIVFPAVLAEQRPDLIEAESLLFHTRREQIETSQRHLGKSLELKTQELEMSRPLAESGVVSRVELLRLEAMVNDLEGQMERESSEYLSEVVSQRNEYSTSLKQVEQALLAYEDKIARTDIKAPVSGIVNKLHVKTIGGILQPGAPLFEIVPTGDSLLVEADIAPEDIAFVKIGQDATVKLTAYDYSVYGGLSGEVERISADTFMNDQGESHYRILVRTGERSLRTSEQELEILPGMVAQVDIKTGKKSVFDYVLKPLMRAKMNAFTER